MYARLALIQLGPGKRTEVDQIMPMLAERLRGLKGFRSVMFFADDKAGEYGSLSLWESEADAEAASKAMRPLVMKAVEGVTSVEGEPRVRHFEVVEPGR
ncbi:MAG TPA: antibiotic biosynthesis monooxygenase [Chloroflexota bacterium]|jgi:heme-degrading monooxygenase HmoA|nr:antibiotic biosynthesis monooxygenase [Chloroflexota bacterium]